MTGLVWALHDKAAGEVWEIDEIEKMRHQIEDHGFNMDVVESVNVHDDIKIGLPTRDQYIENYKQTLRNLAKFGVKVVTYNFMPIFDWTRTDLFYFLYSCIKNATEGIHWVFAGKCFFTCHQLCN